MYSIVSNTSFIKLFFKIILLVKRVIIIAIGKPYKTTGNKVSSPRNKKASMSKLPDIEIIVSVQKITVVITE